MPVYRVLRNLSKPNSFIYIFQAGFSAPMLILTRLRFDA
ncbi:hypothetical protein [Methylomonas albis]|nr:hypothetical protein [Methylomonas albis]